MPSRAGWGCNRLARAGVTETSVRPDTEPHGLKYGLRSQCQRGRKCSTGVTRCNVVDERHTHTALSPPAPCTELLGSRYCSSLLLSFYCHPLLVQQSQPVPSLVVSHSTMSLPIERLIDQRPNLRRKLISADTVNTTLAATVTALQVGGDLVDLAPIPGLSVAVGLLAEILKKVQVSISSSSSGR